MDIGKLIHTRRTELNLTLEEIGNYVGVSKSTVKKWEDGYISNMKRDKIASLAKILKINPVALITGNSEDISTNMHSKKRPMTFSEKLHRKRIESGLSIEELAEASGICENDIKAFEYGIKEPDDEFVIQSLAKVLNTDFISLFSDTNSSPTLTLHDSGNLSSLYRNKIKQLTSDEKLLLNNYNILNKQGKEKLIDYSDDLVGNSKYTDKQGK